MYPSNPNGYQKHQDADQISYKITMRYQSLLKYGIIFTIFWIFFLIYMLNSNAVNENNIYEEKSLVIKLQSIISDMIKNGMDARKLLMSQISSTKSKDYLSDGLTEEAKRYLKELNLTDFGENNTDAVFHEPIPAHIQNITTEMFNKYGFNAFPSSLVSLNRNLPDVRDESCKNRTYRVDKFSKVSIIIPFHNDDWSLLMRTVHSIIRKSPNHLIQEIILVDDNSTYEYLKEGLQNYVDTLPVKVKVIRSHTRIGIVANRVLGAKNAVAPVIIYVDSHVEVIDGWLEPILDRFVDNMDLIVAPNISDTSRFTLKTDFGISNGKIMGMDWGLGFKWFTKEAYEGNRTTPYFDPKPTPVVIFAVLAIGRKFYERIGYLDIDFDIWGAEDFELAIRAWMCGGRVEVVPCSIATHMFRDHKYSMESKGKGGQRWNLDRTAEIWMDEYKEKYYKIAGKGRNFGDISEMLKLKKNLQCKNFQWYLDNVFPALKELP